jgi:hypothetical protein
MYMEIDFTQLLAGGDRRSIGRSEEAVELVLESPHLFSALVDAMLAPNPVVRMRAADAAEKASAIHPELLQADKDRLLTEIASVPQQEVRWHVAQMLPRLKLDPAERHAALAILQGYLTDRSKIVCTFSMQAMADLAQQDPSLLPEVLPLLQHLAETGSPAMRSRGSYLLKRLAQAT